MYEVKNIEIMSLFYSFQSLNKVLTFNTSVLLESIFINRLNFHIKRPVSCFFEQFSDVQFIFIFHFIYNKTDSQPILMCTSVSCLTCWFDWRKSFQYATQVSFYSGADFISCILQNFSHIWTLSDQTNQLSVFRQDEEAAPPPPLLPYDPDDGVTWCCWRRPSPDAGLLRPLCVCLCGLAVPALLSRSVAEEEGGGLGADSVSADSAEGGQGRGEGGVPGRERLAKTHTLLAFWQGQAVK